MQQPEPSSLPSVPTDTNGRSTRRRTLVVAALIGVIVVASLVAGGLFAFQAAAAQERREAHRVDTLGALLDDRSASAELLASSSAVIAVLQSETAQHVDLVDPLLFAHERLAGELARPLEQQATLGVVIAQNRLLDGARGRLIAALDDTTRAVIADARAALESSSLASEMSRSAARGAIDALIVLRQGQPFSYSGRAVMLETALSGSNAVRASHAAAKAEQERLEAERRAAEAAARAPSTSGGSTEMQQLEQRLMGIGCISFTPGIWECPGNIRWDLRKYM